jgi:hypothetical protein
MTNCTVWYGTEQYWCGTLRTVLFLYRSRTVLVQYIGIVRHCTVPVRYRTLLALIMLRYLTVRYRTVTLHDGAMPLYCTVPV